MISDGLMFVRVSTGSQDESTQITELTRYADANKIKIVNTVSLRGYSASKGAQEPALREIIEGIQQKRWRLVLVTDSSRLDRREDLDAQAEILLAIRQAGGDVISVTEPQFGKTDFVGRLVTLVAQYGNAEKSRTVKEQTWRGVKAIIANQAWHGQLPALWHAVGVPYHKAAVCTDPEAVRNAYLAISNGHSLSSVARELGAYARSVKVLIMTRANMTGVFECHYTFAGEKFSWQHTSPSGPVVDAELWHKANRLMNERGARMNNLGGRPVNLAKSWISGLLECPNCGGHLYPQREKALRCEGKPKDRRACGIPTINLAYVTGQIDEIVSSDFVAVYRYQHVSGNQGELSELNAELDRIRHTLSATNDRAEFERLSSRRWDLQDAIDKFDLVPDAYDMMATGETLADLWQTGNKRQILKAIMQHIRFSVTVNGRVSIHGMYPAGDALIELDDKTCIKVSSAGFQRRRLAQYRSEGDN